MVQKEEKKKGEMAVQERCECRARAVRLSCKSGANGWCGEVAMQVVAKRWAMC